MSSTWISDDRDEPEATAEPGATANPQGHFRRIVAFFRSAWRDVDDCDI